MDYILNKFTASIALTKSGETAKLNFLRARIEYVFYLLLGYTWNQYRHNVKLNELVDFVNSMDSKLALGTILNFIKKFDKENKVLTADVERKLRDYNEFRITHLGHGFVYNESGEAEEKMEEIFHELCENAPIMNTSTDIIVVTGKEYDNWEGYCMRDQAHFPELWSCPVSSLNVPFFPCVFYRFNSLSADYCQLSPFIELRKDVGTNVEFFMFFSLNGTSDGQAKYNNLFRDTPELFDAPWLCNMTRQEKYRQISHNKLVMNHFSPNYANFIDVGVRQLVFDFITKNRSSVTAIISGNGGVGKTACVQKVCMDLFQMNKPPFRYVIFVSAKDRKFNEITGKIEPIDHNIKTYVDIIRVIYRTIHNDDPDFLSEEDESFEKFVDSFCNWDQNGQKILLVIDDFETFTDNEKKKIAFFLNRLSINAHKALVTTRNSRLISGYPIETDSFDEEGTFTFISAKIKELYPQHMSYFTNAINSHPDSKKNLQTITDGIPIFMIQWVHLYAQHHDRALLETSLSTRDEARNFLTGRVYSYFNENARILYSALSQIVQKSTLFSKDALKNICGNSIPLNNFEDSFKELEAMNVVEPHGESETIYRVYNESFIDDMVTKFNQLPNATKDSILNKLNQNLGGRVNAPTYDSLLAEAKAASANGNINKADSTYRQIINTAEYPYEKRREALIQLLTIQTMNDQYKKAKDVFEDFSKKYHKFADDPKVIYRYLYSLWGCTDDGQKEYCQETVIGFLKNYFSDSRKPNTETISVYALGATYFSKYTLSLPGSNVDELKRAFQVCLNVYHYVSAFSDQEFTEQILNQRSAKQAVTTALIQGIDTAARLSGRDNQYQHYLNDFANYFARVFPTDKANLKHIQNKQTSVSQKKSSKEALSKISKQIHPSMDTLYHFTFQEAKISNQTNSLCGFKGTINVDSHNLPALLYIKNCASRFINQEEMCVFLKYLKNIPYIPVKILSETKQYYGYDVTLIDVTPSFDDYLDEFISNHE